MKIEIRRAKLSDVEGMSVVVDSAWCENYKEIFSSEQIAEYTGENRRKSFANLVNNSKDVFVLLHDNEIAAVCAAQTCEDKLFEGYAEIMLMYVHPKFQHQGFGSKLLLHTLDEMRSKGYLYAILDTAEKNVNARRFYEKLGFTERNTDESRKFDDVTRIIYTIKL